MRSAAARLTHSLARPAVTPPSSVQAATPSAVKLTGDEQTDKDIAAYFEALAALSR